MSKLHKIICDILALLKYIIGFTLGNKKPIDQHCVCPPALKKPDPFLYSQQYLISLGLPVTWDNPDIYIYEGNTLVDPHNLQANTNYTVVARIWNNSPPAFPKTRSSLSISAAAEIRIARKSPA